MGRCLGKGRHREPIVIAVFAVPILGYEVFSEIAAGL